MSAPPYMRLYWGDYLRDTGHLSCLEHGAYLLLLGALWNGHGRIADDDELLAKLVRCALPDWLAIRPVLAPMFQIRRGKIQHKRLSLELAKYETTLCARREAGRKGGMASRRKDSEIGEANGEANLKQHQHNHNQNHNQKEKKETPSGGKKDPPSGGGSPAVPKEPRPRPTRLPADWAPTEKDLAFAAANGLRNLDRHLTRFRNYWLAKSGSAAVKTDWARTWQNWVLTEIERQPTLPGVAQMRDIQ